MKFAEIIVDVVNSEVDKVFDYLIPEDFFVSVGDMVSVPFGKRTIDGFVLRIKDNTSFDLEKVKSIQTIKISQVIKEDIVCLIQEMKEKFYLRYIDLIKLVVPSEIRNGKIHNKYIRNISLSVKFDFEAYFKTLRKNTKNPILVYKYLQEKAEENYTILCKKFATNTINKLLDLGFLIENKSIKKRLNNIVYKEKKEVVLNVYQKKAVETIIKSDYKTFLLHGVTGSGKTEVYLRIIKNCLNNNKTAIMLVPEISLTPQMVSIFTSLFGEDVAVLHSGLSAGEKFDEWQRIYNGDAKIVVGARSAIFAPLKDIGVVIIDEEHDNSYISDSNPRYETYQVAQIRAKLNKCPVVLGSATPNIETYYKANMGEFELLELPVRANNKEMPKIDIVDMLPEFRNGNTSIFSNKLTKELSNTIKNGNQAIMFINRRGFSSFISCKSCGYIPRCTECDITLSYHKECNELKCHYCGKRFRNITKCPECNSEEIKLGGVGTQRVVEELTKMFNVPVFRMDVDSTKTKNGHAKILAEFSNTKPSILVGTQMIAKGHDFPQVDLVGILDADLSLFFGEFRSAEKTFQLITQVAGRAGRSDIEGKVVLQTYFPNNYVYNLVSNYDYKRFYNKEINLRKTTNFPPFSEIVRILISNENEDVARDVTRDVFQEIKKIKMEYRDNIFFVQAMQSPLNRLKNKYRFQIVMRYKKELSTKILEQVYDYLDVIDNKKSSVFVELNPLNLS